MKNGLYAVFSMVFISMLMISCPSGGDGNSSNGNPGAGSGKAITAFSINGVAGVINEAEKTITLTLPAGTNLTNLSPSITHTGSGISPQSGAARNFTNPVSYTVTAQDGSIAVYQVTVSVQGAPPRTEKAITAFSINGVVGVINEAGKTITLTLPAGTNLTALSPVITHTGSGINPQSGESQNFTNSMSYTVTAQDGSIAVYQVMIEKDTTKAITEFSINGIAGVINEAEKTITLTLPAGTNLTNLSPVITHTGSGISPQSGVFQNFTNPMSYTVTAQDGSIAVYQVTVQKALLEGSISIVNPQDTDQITLTDTYTSPLSRSQNSSFTVTVAGSDRVAWFVDQTAQSDQGVSLTISAKNYSAGTYTITVIAYKGSIPYSKELTFQVVE